MIPTLEKQSSKHAQCIDGLQMRPEPPFTGVSGGPEKRTLYGEMITKIIR